MLTVGSITERDVKSISSRHRSSAASPRSYRLQIQSPPTFFFYLSPSFSLSLSLSLSLSSFYPILFYFYHFFSFPFSFLCYCIHLILFNCGHISDAWKIRDQDTAVDC